MTHDIKTHLADLMRTRSRLGQLQVVGPQGYTALGRSASSTSISSPMLAINR